jgi:hypothetical protein
MEVWENATAIESHLFKTISMIFDNHPHLLEFFFEKERARLRLKPMDMRKAAAGFSLREQILIRVALDAWNGLGNAKVWLILDRLDSKNLYNCLNALVYRTSSNVPTFSI